ncbi:MAG: efflux RND transporter periplasmic adaptor subunit [Acidobacteriia bacterium]|nr:efflux RND transporter periplasmic adaptor subunit [Terriglobia bacterium]
MPNYPMQKRIMTAAALWMVCLAAGCSQNAPQEAEPVAPVQTATVQRASIERIIQARGILHAFDQATVIPKITAPIRELYVNRGAHVRKGQLLAVLENRDLAAAAAEARGLVDQAAASYQSMTAASLPEELTKAQTDVQSAKEALDAAQKLYESRKALLEQGALPRRQVDEANVGFVQARSQFEVAEKHLDALQKVSREAETKQVQAQLEAARARSQGAEVQLEYSRILSPIDGVITERPLYAGEMAGAGTPLLTVMDISRVIARANVPAEQLTFLKAGNPAAITALDSTAELRGKVTVVSPALDPNSTTAEVWVEAPNPGERFKPGASVQVSILAETVSDAVVIPLAAILPSQEGENIVLVVGSDSLAHEKKIETGIRQTDKVQVLMGLDPGEQVIVVGGLGLEDKTKVRVEKPGEKTGEQIEKKVDEQPGKKADQKTDEKTDQHD